MKDIRVYTKAFAEEAVSAGAGWYGEHGCVLMGCIGLYRATGEAAFRDGVLRLLDSCAASDGSGAGSGLHDAWSAGIGRALFFALHEMGDERCRGAIEQCMQRLGEQPHAACGLPVRSGETVSYTHLRAHET